MLTRIAAPAYPYHQFEDDADIVALFAAYNALAQHYLDWMLAHPLALYMRDEIQAGLLNYAAYCLYGISRLQVSYRVLKGYDGAIDATAINEMPIDGTDIDVWMGTQDVGDDFFKRVMTWNLYKGDGCQFTIPWLKRRIMRFLTGTNGHAWRFNSTAPVSVAIKGQVVQVTVEKGIADEGLIGYLGIFLNNGTLQIPPNFSYNIGVSQ